MRTFFLIRIIEIEYSKHVKISDFTDRPHRIEMHVKVDLGYLFLFAKDTEPFQHRDNLFTLIQDFKFLFLDSDQTIPLQKENFVPVADVIKIVDSETF